MTIGICLAMVMYTFLPVTRVAAEESTVNVRFDSNNISGNVVTFTVDNKDVTLTVNGATITKNGDNYEINIDRSNLGAVTFTIGDTFDAETMEVVVRGANDYRNSIAVNDSKASLEGLTFPDVLNLNIEHKNNGGNNQNSTVNVKFDSEHINGNVVTFKVDDKDVTLTVNGATITNGEIEIDRNNLGAVTFTIGNTFNDETMEVVVRGANEYNNSLVVNNSTASLNGLNFPDGGLHLSIENKNNGGNPPGPGEGGEAVGGEDSIAFDIAFTGTNMHVWINGKDVNNFNGTVERAGSVNTESTNVLRFQEDFGDKPVAEYEINGITYKVGMSGVEEKEGQGIFITVPGADKYVIRGTAVANAVVDRTIIWANVDADTNSEEYNEDMLLKHGSAKIIAVYDEQGNRVPTNDYIGKDADEYGVSKDGLGWAKVIPGSKVVFEFVPEYGYQLTSVMSNGFALEPQDTINQYTFIMPDANVHFSAEFTKTEDVVKADSEKVSGGNIELGNDLAGGSAQLTVSDVELSADKIAGFNEAAGEYTVSNYLDINLYNVYYKGKNDADDVWLDQIDELEEYAIISIQLEDGVDADDIVIVHNVHNGDEYEIIEIDSYDPETNTITFKTKSFSNYAIATKKDPVKVNASEKEAAQIMEETTKIIDKILAGKTVEGISPSLQEAIKDAVDNNKTITIDLKKDSVKESDVSKDAAEIQSLMGSNAHVSGYFDITIEVSIEGTYAGNITLLDDVLIITLNVPNDQPEVASGYTRKYTVVRVHDGVAEKLDTILNDDGTITFKTDKFSTYAITYTDSRTSTPDTGDDISVYLTTLLLSVAGMAGAGLFFLKRKKVSDC